MPKRTIRESDRTWNLIHYYKLNPEAVYEEAIWQAAVRAMPLGKLTPGTQQLLLDAEREAQQVGHEMINDVHLLLAMLNDSTSVVCQTLRDMNLVEPIRAKVLEVVQSPGYNSSSNRVMDQTGKQLGFMHADAEGERYIGDADGVPLRISLNPDGSTTIADAAGNPVQLDADGRIVIGD